jgi:hypothetical protein
MPRLFVNNYQVNNISSKLNNLEDYYVGTNVRKMIFSPDGIFQLKGSNMTKMIPVDIPVIQLDGFVVDNSYYDERDVVSQIPFDHHYAEIVEHRYCVDKKSCVHLVIEGIYTNNNETNISGIRSNLVNNVEQEKSRYVGFQPKSFYFWSLENLDNELISKEVNMLLTII